MRAMHAVLHRQPAIEDNTIEGARANIRRHYDLSNDLFKVFLDDSLTYSSALFAGDPADSPDDLSTAQHRKIDRKFVTRAGLEEAAHDEVVDVGRHRPE